MLRAGQDVLVVIRIHLAGDSDLPQVAETSGGTGAPFGFRQGRQ
jgi:hypothetical protein